MTPPRGVKPATGQDNSVPERRPAGEPDVELIRFLTGGGAGSGKSTLAGLLLAESQQVSDGRDSAPVPGAMRKFICADVPGDGRWTRNMVTGAPGCDFAILVVDASKDVLTQTRRHCCIVNLLGIRKIALAVNKMDLVDWSQDRFERIAADFARFSEPLGFEEMIAIPVSAAQGDNIIASGTQMDWYRGPALKAHLETVDIAPDQAAGPFRMPVQSVSGPGSDCPGIAGTLTGGALHPGDEIVALPAGRQTRVERIVTHDGDLDAARTGDAVTLTLGDEFDVSPGDVLCARGAEAEVSDQIAANVIWMDTKPMLPGRNYIFRCGNQTATASISTLKHKLNFDTLEHQAATKLELNDVGYYNLSLHRALVFDAYARNREMGGFILIDRQTNATVGAGMIEFGLRRATNIKWQALQIDKSVRAVLKDQKPCALWFTGLSGSGKSTVASLLEKQLHERGRHTYVLDGDNVRHGLNKDLGFTDADRVENIRRVAETAKLFVDAGLIVMVSFISPFRSERRMARGLFEETEFLEVFVDTPIEICEQRDPKGLYKKARAGEIKNFTGIDSAYEEPERADIILEAGKLSPDEVVATLIARLEEMGFI